MDSTSTTSTEVNSEEIDKPHAKFAIWLAAFLLGIPHVWWHLFGQGVGFSTRAFIALTSLSAVAALIALRWDRRLRFPSRWSWILFLSAGASSAMAAAFNLSWFAGLSFCLVVVAFLTTHSTRKSPASLTPIFASLTGFLGLPFVFQLALADFCGPLLSQCLQAGLKFFEVPHVSYPSALVLPTNVIYLDASTLTSGWLLGFLAVAGIYSSIFRRSIAQCAVNGAIAILVWFLFGFGFPLFDAVIRSRVEAFDEYTYAPNLLRIVSLLVCGLLFLSLERLARILLYPISDSYMIRWFNPLVAAWNYLADGGRRRRESRREEGHARWWLGFAASLLSLLLMAGSLSWRAKSVVFADEVKFNWQEVDLRSVALEESGFEFRRLSHLKQMQTGLGASIWSYRDPLLVEEYAVFDSAVEASVANALASARGWDFRYATSLEDARVAKQQSKTASRISKLVYETLMVDNQGDLVFPNENRDLADSLCTIQVLAEYLGEPTEAELESLGRRLSELAQRVAVRSR